MTNDELKDIWDRQSAMVASVAPEKIWRLAKASERFERTIFWRDAREWIATAVVVGFDLYFAFAKSRVNWWLVLAAVLACLPMTYASFLRWKSPVASPSDSLKGHLHESIAGLRHQIDLLHSVHWWYLAPLALSILLVFTALRQWERGPVHTAIFFVFGIVFFIGVWMLNQHAIRTDFRPRLRELEETLRELEPENF